MNDPAQFDTEKRLLFALLLSTAVLLLAPYFMRSFFPAPPEAPLEEIMDDPAPPPVRTETQPARAAARALPQTPHLPTQGNRRMIEILGEDLALRFSSAGAQLESARLTGYQSKSSEEWLELIPQDLAPEHSRPLALSTPDRAVAEELAEAVYEIEGNPLPQVRAPIELVFRYRGERVEVTRRLKIPAAGYTFELETSVRTANGSQPFSVALGPALGKDLSSPAAGLFTITAGDFAYPGVVYHAGGNAHRIYLSDLEQDQTLGTDISWTAFDSQFFSQVLLTPDGSEYLSLKKSVWTSTDAQGAANEATLMPLEVGLPPDARTVVFLGPKHPETLRAVEPTLTQLIDYGWLAVLVKPLVSILKLIYGVVHNYGWAIIILTFLINLALLPIRYKQIISMKKMTALQPKLKAIQGRYKKLPRRDPKRQEMNREIMALYQQHGVNPLGSCLPLLLQMPFLFAFYRMLAGSIELRGAPFMLWIQDLSQHDPYYVTPVVMGASMVLQQKMMPATGDPTQRRMMMMMPIMFTYFFLWVSSGLALYFLFSNAFGILFQVGIQRMNREEPPSSKPKQRRQGRKSKKR